MKYSKSHGITVTHSMPVIAFIFLQSSFVNLEMLLINIQLLTVYKAIFTALVLFSGILHVSLCEIFPLQYMAIYGLGSKSLLAPM